MRVTTVASVFALMIASVAVGCGDDDEETPAGGDAGVKLDSAASGSGSGGSGGGGAGGGGSGGNAGRGGSAGGGSGGGAGGGSCANLPTCVKDLLAICAVPAGTACTKQSLGFGTLANYCYPSQNVKFVLNVMTGQAATKGSTTCFTVATMGPTGAPPTSGTIKDGAGATVATATFTGLETINVTCNGSATAVSFPTSCLSGAPTPDTCTTVAAPACQ